MSLWTWLATKFLKNKLDLQEDAQMDSKPWYKSETLWSDVLTIITLGIGIADTHFGTHIATTQVYGTIIAILSGIGIHGRLTATTTIQ